MTETPAHTGVTGGFFGLPGTTSGRITAVLFLIVVISIALMATVIEPAQPAWRGVFAAFIIVTVVATAVAGLAAVVLKRDRSWAVTVPLLLALFLLVNEVLQRL